MNEKYVKVCVFLHCERVEASIHHGNRAGDELRGVAHEVVDGAAQLLGVAHPAERGLVDDVLAALCVRAVGVGQQRAVLLGDEEAGGYGVDADALAELLGALGGHEGREVADAGLRGSVSANAGDGAERSHRREVDDGALALLDHRLEEHLRRDDRAGEVEVEDFLEFLHLQVEDVAVGRYHRAGHVAASGVEQRVYAPVLAQYGVAVLLYQFLVHHVGLHELGLAAFLRYAVYDFLADARLAPEYYHLRAFEGEVSRDCAAEYACAARDYNYVILDVE